ncbi:MAG: ankyrin repeat domain-containing protein [Candidatus Zixiibacteriota bacterium]
MTRIRQAILSFLVVSLAWTQPVQGANAPAGPVELGYRKAVADDLFYSARANFSPNPFATYEDGETVWSITAARWRFAQALEALFENGLSAEVTDRWGRTPMLVALSYGAVEPAKVALSRTKVPERALPDGRTALHLIARYDSADHMGLARTLLAKKLPVNASDNMGWTPLMVAAAAGSRGMVELFLEAGAEVNARTNLGDTALSMATFVGSAEIVDRLLRAGARPAVSSDGLSAQDMAMIGGCRLCAELISRHDFGDLSEIHDAARKRAHAELDMIKLVRMPGSCFPSGPQNASAIYEEVLHRVATCDRRARKSQMLLDEVVKDGRLTVPFALVSSRQLHDVASGKGEVDGGALIDSLGQNLWHWAALERNAASCGPTTCGDVNGQDVLGVTPLMLAAWAGNSRTVSYLVRNGAEIGLKSSDGRIALHYASNTAVADVLMTSGADLADRDKAGNTSLHHAAMRGSRSLVEALVAAGAKMNDTNHSGRTPLELAVQTGEPALESAIALFSMGAKAGGHTLGILLTQVMASGSDDAGPLLNDLIKAGADANACDDFGRSGLGRAGNAGLAKALLATGRAKLNVRCGDEKRSALHVAVRDGNVSLAEELISSGANVNVVDGNGATPLFSAGSKDVAELLISQGSNVGHRDKEGRSALHMAAQDGRPGVAAKLIDRGADPNARDIFGNTPLHFAAANLGVGQLEVLHLLLFHRADPKARNRQGETPLHFLAAKGVLPGSDIVLQAVEGLIAAGADPNVRRRPDGRTPLHLADRVDVVWALGINGASSRLRDKSGRTPQRIMMEKNSFGACLLYPTPACDKASPLLMTAAIQNGRADQVGELIARGHATSSANGDKSPAALAYALAKQAQIDNEKLDRSARVDERIKRLEAVVHRSDVARLLIACRLRTSDCRSATSSETRIIEAVRLERNTRMSASSGLGGR